MRLCGRNIIVLINENEYKYVAEIVDYLKNKNPRYILAVERESPSENFIYIYAQYNEPCVFENIRFHNTHAEITLASTNICLDRVFGRKPINKKLKETFKVILEEGVIDWKSGVYQKKMKLTDYELYCMPQHPAHHYRKVRQKMYLLRLARRKNEFQ